MYKEAKKIEAQINLFLLFPTAWMFGFGTVLMFSSNFMSVITSLLPFLLNFKWLLGILGGAPWVIYGQVKDSDSGETRNNQ